MSILLTQLISHYVYNLKNDKLQFVFELFRNCIIRRNINKNIQTTKIKEVIIVKNSKFIILLIAIIFILWSVFPKTNPLLKGFYQSEMIEGHIIQMLVRQEDNSFVEWIDNREVDRGTYEKLDEKSYRINSNSQDFKITLNDDNSFKIVIGKLNDGASFVMKNITTDDVRMSFGTFEDVDEYKSLLD